MSFLGYIKDKASYILAFIVYCVIVIFYAEAMQINNNFIIVIIAISFIFASIGFVVNYLRKNKYINEINSIIDGLEEKYLISEVIEKPKREEDLAYYKILKRTNKSMLENITKTRMAQKDYKDYIESWVHEIKLPITSAKLLCENNKSEITNKIDEEVEKINNYVEQALFYARLDQVSNDFMIRKISLADVVRNVLARNKKIMIQNNIKVEVKDIAVNVFSDEKWLEFILNQIIINSIKYKKEQNAIITISGVENKENVHLKIKDNGIGIKESEINRIFDKGFTGTNGRNQKKSTGIGLYLCKRLCEELDMNLTAKSKENEYTEITIIIPRNKRID